MASSFDDLAQLGKSHLENLFKEDQQTTIAEIIQVSQFFPKIITEEDNSDLMEEVTNEELKATLHSFQRDKSPGPVGWVVEFFLAAFEIIGPDLLKLVEESRINGLLHPH